MIEHYWKKSKDHDFWVFSRFRLKLQALKNGKLLPLGRGTGLKTTAQVLPIMSRNTCFISSNNNRKMDICKHIYYVCKIYVYISINIICICNHCIICLICIICDQSMEPSSTTKNLKSQIFNWNETSSQGCCIHHYLCWRWILPVSTSWKTAVQKSWFAHVCVFLRESCILFCAVLFFF